MPSIFCMLFPNPRRAAWVASIAFAGSLAVAAFAIDYPPTPRKPVVDTYPALSVTDEYRWLEDDKDPAVVAWDEAQTRVARGYLDALPLRASIAKRLRELYDSEPVRYYDFTQRRLFFALKREPRRNQPVLVAMKRAGDMPSERVVLDPNALDAKGTTAIDFYVPSLDGRYVAVVMSEKGSEEGPARVFETGSGKALADTVPRVQYPTGGGSVEWDAASEGFFYTRYPQGDERPEADRNFYQQVWYHRLGTPASADTYAIGKEFPRIAETHLEATRDGKFLLAKVANGDGGEFSFYLRGPEGHWMRVAEDADKVRDIQLGFDGKLYALSLKGAPRGKVLAMPMADPQLAKAAVIVPEANAAIEQLAPTQTRLYVDYMAGGPSELRVFDLAGKALGTVPIEAVSSASIGERLTGDEILIGMQSYVTPPAWYRYSPPSTSLVKTALGGKTKVSFADSEVVREMCVSKDGTRVPVNILMRKGTKRDGNNPALLYGYGGYGINMTPHFSLGNRVWLDHGGIFAVANLRGGGEFGEAWHLGGNLTRKQNVFDDMIGCAEHLVKARYTKPARLAALGGSNGGLLMGAILVQRPDLFRAVASQVGIYDMLRVELTPNGAFNVTEFGTIKDAEQLKALYAYSPYHHVKDGTAYPAVLLTTGEHDGRVDPYNSRKMAARLQAASAPGNPVLLLVNPDTGHGIGTGRDKRIEEMADVDAFLMSQLGMR